MKLSKHWLLLILCCGLSTCSIGLSINCSGIFYTPVAESLGILRGSFALHMTIFSIVTAVFAFVIPTLMKKFPYKLLLTVSVMIAVITTALMGFVKTLSMFYILGSLRGMSTALFSSVPLTMIINNWFVEKHGLATSIVFSFSGVAGTIFSPILTKCIESFGWQTTYMIMGVLILLFSLPSILVPFKLNPEDENLLPLGGKKEIIEIKETNNETSFNFLSIPFIAFFSVGLFVAGSTGLTQHFPGYAQSIGYSASTGAMLVSSAMMGNIIFKLLVGILSDKIGIVKTIYLLLCIIIAGTALMILGVNDIFMIAGAFMFGATYGIGAVGLALLTKHFFGIEKYAVVYPSIAFSTNMGSAVMLSLVGYIYDFFGSYIYAFIAILFVIILSIGLMRITEKATV